MLENGKKGHDQDPNEPQAYGLQLTFLSDDVVEDIKAIYQARVNGGREVTEWPQDWNSASIKKQLSESRATHGTAQPLIWKLGASAGPDSKFIIEPIDSNAEVVRFRYEPEVEAVFQDDETFLRGVEVMSRQFDNAINNYLRAQGVAAVLLPQVGDQKITPEIRLTPREIRTHVPSLLAESLGRLEQVPQFVHNSIYGRTIDTKFVAASFDRGGYAYQVEYAFGSTTRADRQMPTREAISRRHFLTDDDFYGPFVSISRTKLGEEDAVSEQIVIGGNLYGPSIAYCPDTRHPDQLIEDTTETLLKAEEILSALPEKLQQTEISAQEVASRAHSSITWFRYHLATVPEFAEGLVLNYLHLPAQGVDRPLEFPITVRSTHCDYRIHYVGSPYKETLRIKRYPLDHVKDEVIEEIQLEIDGTLGNPTERQGRVEYRRVNWATMESEVHKNTTTAFEKVHDFIERFCVTPEERAINDTPGYDQALVRM